MLGRVEEGVVALLFAGASILMVAQVVLRYIFNVTHGWYVELINYSLIWAALIGASVGVREGVHIGVDVVVQRLPGRLRTAVQTLALLVSAGFCAYVAFLSVEYVGDVAASSQVTPEMEIPKWWVYLVLPFTFASMALRFLLQAARAARGATPAGHGPHHDHGVRGMEV